VPIITVLKDSRCEFGKNEEEARDSGQEKKGSVNVGTSGFRHVISRKNNQEPYGRSRKELACLLQLDACIKVIAVQGRN